MAPSKTTGRGRVLGAAKPSNSTSELSPAVDTAPDRVRGSNRLLSPSPSSASLDSHGSTQKSSLEDHDISSAVALEARDNAAASTRLVCPICDEEMVTLLQLNRHLDDDHKNLEVIEQDEVKTWFKTQLVKAKKFQPLAVLNQKLKGFDIFESNEDPAPVMPSTSTPSRPGQTVPPPPAQVYVDPDSLVTKDHWQRYSQTGLCSDPMCGKRLGGTNGNINCRKCGKLFCEEHTMYQMKLSRSAQHEPVRGSWLRVCETCYISREGYNDHNGFQRDHMTTFAKVRRAAVDKSYLEASRLEKRLTKLTQLLADPSLQEQDQGVVGYFKSFSGGQTPQRLAEQSIVEWEDDASVLKCPFCHQEFFSYSFRRHHCRVCGRVVCADPQTQCSLEVGLDVAAKSNQDGEKATSVDIKSIDIRMCKDCRRTVFSKADFQNEINAIGPDQKAFHNLKQFEAGIESMLPRFRKLLSTLQDPARPPTPAQLTEAAKVRKRLTDGFTQYTIAAQRIRDLPTQSPTQQRLQKQIYASASQFLHLHMLTLKSVPKMLKSANMNHINNGVGVGLHSRSSSSSSVLTNNTATSTALNGHGAAQTNGSRPHVQSALQNSTSVSSDKDAKVEDEKKAEQLREQLVVLEEQKYMIGEMLADAQRRRKFDDVESLGRNIDDIERELKSVREALGDG